MVGVVSLVLLTSGGIVFGVVGTLISPSSWMINLISGGVLTFVAVLPQLFIEGYFLPIFLIAAILKGALFLAGIQGGDWLVNRLRPPRTFARGV